MTSQTPEATEIEEVVEEIGNLLQTGEYDKAVAYLHQQLQKAQEELSQERTGFLDHIAKLEKTHQEELQKARHVWLREEIVRLEKDFLKGDPMHDAHQFYQVIHFNEAIQTIIDYYQAELDTTSPVYKFFTAPEEVRRPAIEEALKKASQEQSELDQDTVTTVAKEQLKENLDLIKRVGNG